MKYFSPELRTASIVPRWSIVWTQTRDTVSNHSFFVTLYADQIADLIRWDRDRGDLLFMAAAHDLDETITGDIVAPAKRAILDTGAADKYIQKNMATRLPYVVERTASIQAADPTTYHEAKAIIKAADRLDALIFLVVEQRLGNSVIAPRIPECWATLEQAWLCLPSGHSVLEQTWNDVIKPAVALHRTTGGYGI